MPEHSSQGKPAAWIYTYRIVMFSFPMEGSSLLPVLANESLSLTKQYIILKDSPLQKQNFLSIYFCLSAVPVCSRGTMIYPSPQPAEQFSLLEVPAENTTLQLLLCHQRPLPKGCKPENLPAPRGSCPTGKPKHFILKGHKFRECWQTKHLKPSLLDSFTEVSILI